VRDRHLTLAGTLRAEVKRQKSKGTKRKAKGEREVLCLRFQFPISNFQFPVSSFRFGFFARPATAGHSSLLKGCENE